MAPEVQHAELARGLLQGWPVSRRRKVIAWSRDCPAVRKDENPAMEPDGEAKILARKTRELLRL